MKVDILIVDDSKDMLEVLGRQLNNKGFNTFKATNVVDAVDLLKLNIPKLLITDVQMPGINGGKLVKYSKKKFPELPVLVITGHPSSDDAEALSRDKSLGFLIKPFTQAELYAAVDKIFAKENSHKETKQSIQQIKDSTFAANKAIIGRSKSLESTFHLIDRTKNNKVSVLITGESGTGKELVARAIHYGGKFSEKPFVAVNCGAIPDNLLETELFGYEKGAFTGAEIARSGFFQAANNGTIFLDEIGNAPLNVQKSLLRVIQEKEIIPVGSRESQKIDIRIIAATNSSLSELVKAGTFREDLYYRLNVVNINVPPLRERKSDIRPLTEHFIEKHSLELGKNEVSIHANAIKILEQYAWPGNIRELENIVHQALVMCDDKIETKHLPEYLHFPPSLDKRLQTSSLKSLKEVELDHIEFVLARCNNNKTKAAEILGITRKTLAQKLQ